MRAEYKTLVLLMFVVALLAPDLILPAMLAAGAAVCALEEIARRRS